MSVRTRIFLAAIVALVLVSLFGLILGNMGFLNALFGKKTVAGDTAVSTGVDHQEDWAAYLTTVDNDKVGSILVDLGLKAIAPISNKPRRLRVDIIMNSPGENGLPTQSEFASLNGIDEKLSVGMKRNIGAIYAGHLYCQGTMSLYYYLGNDDEFETEISESMSSFSNYKYSYKLDEERNWESYIEFLYPLPIQMQSIHNRKVIDYLRNNGDRLNKKRTVDHLIYFKTENDLSGFLNEIKGKGFQVVSKERTDLEEYTWSVLLRRDDPVDPESVDNYVLYLWQKAHDANGDYDGWGSTIVRE